MPFYDDDSVHYDDESVFYDDDGGVEAGLNPLPQNLPSFGTAYMEYWEITKDRAQKTLSVWNLHTPTLEVAGQGPAVLEGKIDEFEPAAQLRTTDQDAFDAKVRTVGTALLKMKILATKVAQIIDAQLSSDASIQDDLGDVFRIVPRSEPTILARARALYPVWVRANTVLAAMTPAAGPITRPIQGVAHTAVMLKALLDGYTTMIQERNDAESKLNKTRGALRTLDRTTDRLAKDWYQIVKNTYDPGTPAYDALSEIPTEQGTPAPDPIDINELVQGGATGLQVLVSYIAGGGDHATTKQIEYKVNGIDADFAHAADLDPSGNALGPFVVGQVVQVRTKVSNSSGVRTSAVRTITMETPL
ncbi:MAG TPA: hypothetical protein VGO11_05790 [Chthoniobacteraceae bacterium]|jgi:hypothetical protein|nr:hypothetical protein [Chthoniobacteraceae bacterium]